MSIDRCNISAVSGLGNAVANHLGSTLLELPDSS